MSMKVIMRMEIGIKLWEIVVMMILEKLGTTHPTQPLPQPPIPNLSKPIA